MKKTQFLAALLFVLLAVSFLTAQEISNVFPLFLSKLVERHEELKTLAMPEVEMHTVPEEENEAVYMLSFKSPEDGEFFTDVLKKENIPYGMIGENGMRIILFHSDLIAFIMKAVIGL